MGLPVKVSHANMDEKRIEVVYISRLLLNIAETFEKKDMVH